MAGGFSVSVFALSDLHLGFAVNKPMDIFGSTWKNHSSKIKANWMQAVGKDDIILVPGDISWGINFTEAKEDLNFLDSLPGKKFISRGNHDYWWGSLKKVEQFVGSSIVPLQREAINCGGFVLAASKGWNTPLWDGFKPSNDSKLYRRELERMKLTLERAAEMKESGQKLVYMMHFPPVIDGEPSEFAELLCQAEVSLCLYGHLHEKWSPSVNMEHNGVKYRIVSADYLNFMPLDITEEVYCK
jgi:predicted phosphohydrolase